MFENYDNGEPDRARVCRVFRERWASVLTAAEVTRLAGGEDLTRALNAAVRAGVLRAVHFQGKRFYEVRMSRDDRARLLYETAQRRERRR
jgi:hypothetical protein